MKMATMVVRAGMGPLAQGDPFLGSVTFAGTYRAAGDPTASPYTYGRYHNPTWAKLEQALGDLEGGYALCFASGMAAITATLSLVLQPGDTLALPSDSYYTMRLFADGFLTRIGVKIRRSATSGNAQVGDLKGARMVWLESPSNPGLEVCDIAELSKAAHQEGALVAVDNTSATAVGQRPLELGADFSVASDTKAITGHGDLILGHVAVRDATWKEKLHSWRNLAGAVPGPMEAWLAHRSLASAEMRLSRQSRNALRVAEFLRGRTEITSLRYPGLPDDRSHEIAGRQMKFFGPIVVFTLATREAAEHFLASCQLIIEATSFGGIHTTAERRARWGGDSVADGFIRLSVGCEDSEDIIEDLEQALLAAQTKAATRRD